MMEKPLDMQERIRRRMIDALAAGAVGQRELAREAGVAHSTLKFWLRGSTETLRLPTLQAIDDALDRVEDPLR